MIARTGSILDAFAVYRLRTPPPACLRPQRFVVRHAGGHVIPASKAVAGRLHDFLAHVQHQEQQQQQDAGQQQRVTT